MVRYAKNARLFLRGTPADNLMLIVSGAVRIYCPHGGSRNVMRGLAGPGEIIGYADFLDSKGRCCMAFEAQALTNCSVALISRQRLERELGRLDSSILLSVLAAANTFWTSMVYRCVSLMGMTFRERLEAVIPEVAEKFGVKNARGTLLTLELGHDDWAALIASSRSLASKLVSELIAEGILERDGKRYTILKEAIFNKRQDGRTKHPCQSDSQDGADSRNGRTQFTATALSTPIPNSFTVSKRVA